VEIPKCAPDGRAGSDRQACQDSEETYEEHPLRYRITRVGWTVGTTAGRQPDDQPGHDGEKGQEERSRSEERPRHSEECGKPPAAVSRQGVDGADQTHRDAETHGCECTKREPEAVVEHSRSIGTGLSRLTPGIVTWPFARSHGPDLVAQRTAADSQPRLAHTSIVAAARFIV